MTKTAADLGRLPRRLLRRAELAFYSLPPLTPGLPCRRPGQTTVEYLLLLAMVAAGASMMGILFHRRILGGVFTIVGMIIGAGKPE